MNFPPTVDLTNAFPFTDENGEAWPGMTIRDYFAGQAIAGLSANPQTGGDVTSKTLARVAYRMADCMMAERNKTL